MDNFTKEIIKKTKKPLTYVGLFLLFYNLLSIHNIFTIICLVFGLNIIIDNWDGIVEKSQGYVKAAIVLSIILYVMQLLGAYGVIGFIISIVLLVVYKLYKGKDMYLSGMRNIEEKIWGKPLDKENWKDEINKRKD